MTHVKRRTRLCIHNEIIESELTIYDWNVINKSKKATRTKLDLLKHITKFNLPNEFIILLLGAKKYLSLIYVVVSIYFASEYRFCWIVSFDFIINLNLTDFVHFNKTSYRNCLFFFLFCISGTPNHVWVRSYSPEQINRNCPSVFYKCTRSNFPNKALI